MAKQKREAPIEQGYRCGKNLAKRIDASTYKTLDNAIEYYQDIVNKFLDPDDHRYRCVAAREFWQGKLKALLEAKENIIPSS